MRTIEAASVNREIAAGATVWTFTEAGDGYLVNVKAYNNDTGWLRCDNVSYLVCSNEPCYVYDSVSERGQHEGVLRAALNARRAAFRKGFA